MTLLCTHSLTSALPKPRALVLPEVDAGPAAGSSVDVLERVSSEITSVTQRCCSSLLWALLDLWLVFEGWCEGWEPLGAVISDVHITLQWAVLCLQRLLVHQRQGYSCQRHKTPPPNHPWRGTPVSQQGLRPNPQLILGFYDLFNLVRLSDLPVVNSSSSMSEPVGVNSNLCITCHSPLADVGTAF